MTGPGPEDGRAVSTRVRWWQRAVPIAILTALAAGVGVLSLPSNELELSTSRLPQEYVELSLADDPRAVCGTRSDRRARVQFRLINRLEQAHTFRFRVVVEPAAHRERMRTPGRKRIRDRGGVRLEPGESVLVRARLARTPARAHAVAIRLAQRPEHLRIHCRGQRPQEVTT